MKLFIRLVATSSLCLICSSLPGQFPVSRTQAGLTATKTQTIHMKPEKLRLIMSVQAQATDPKSAIQSLRDHKDRLTKELEAMKCDTKSITFSEAQLESSGGAQQSRPSNPFGRVDLFDGEQYVAAIDDDEGNDQMPTVYTAKSNLRAEWPLPIHEGDALALLPITLKEQIEKRDFAGKRNQPEFDAEDAERMEELEAMRQEQYSYGYEESGQNRMAIYYVATVSDKQLKSATKSAYEAAVADAQFISDATGVGLGKLVSLSSSKVHARMTGEDVFDIFTGITQHPMGRSASEAPSADNEVVAQSIDQLACAVSVTVVFDVP